MATISGFSALTASEKIEHLHQTGIIDSESRQIIGDFIHHDPEIRGLIEKTTENVIGSYHLPFSIVPNMVINGEAHMVPMVIEESSVVAAAAWSAKYWAVRGGFVTRVISDIKIGQIHFIWQGDGSHLSTMLPAVYIAMKEQTADLTARMEERGGGIVGFEHSDLSAKIAGYHQIRVLFRTADSMGANFINSCLERMAEVLRETAGAEAPLEIVMAILSNYTPDCLVECTVSTPIEHLTGIRGAESPQSFARRFKLAADIAAVDPYRAVTHNKGIYNGIDAVVMATANDYRAVEACGHAWAAHGGSYASLTEASIDNGTFTYKLMVPMALGTVGGLTSTHPMARVALKIMGQPSAPKLMQIAAAAGLANNFSALKALTTKGIQDGHMRMHLPQILNQLAATGDEAQKVRDHFSNKTIGFRAVADYIESLRNKEH